MVLLKIKFIKVAILESNDMEKITMYQVFIAFFGSFLRFHVVRRLRMYYCQRGPSLSFRSF